MSEVFNQQALKEVARRVTAHAPDGSLDLYIIMIWKRLKPLRRSSRDYPKTGTNFDQIERFTTLYEPLRLITVSHG
jgi:hypothetical protein